MTRFIVNYLNSSAKWRSFHRLRIQPHRLMKKYSDVPLP